MEKGWIVESQALRVSSPLLGDFLERLQQFDFFPDSEFWIFNLVAKCNFKYLMKSLGISEQVTLLIGNLKRFHPCHFVSLSRIKSNRSSTSFFTIHNSKIKLSFFVFTKIVICSLFVYLFFVNVLPDIETDKTICFDISPVLQKGKHDQILTQF